MGELITFVFFFLILKEPYSLAHQQIFWNIEALPNGSISLDPKLQMYSNIAETFSVYRHEN
jgi:hypothetical protein